MEGLGTPKTLKNLCFFKIFAVVGFRYFGALDGLLGPILAPFGPIWSRAFDAWERDEKEQVEEMKCEPRSQKRRGRPKELHAGPQKEPAWPFIFKASQGF